MSTLLSHGLGWFHEGRAVVNATQLSRTDSDVGCTWYLLKIDHSPPHSNNGLTFPLQSLNPDPRPL